MYATLAVKELFTSNLAHSNKVLIKLSNYYPSLVLVQGKKSYFKTSLAKVLSYVDKQYVYKMSNK